MLGPVGTAPFTGLYAQRTWIESSTRWPRCRSAPWPTARWWSTSARSTPPVPWSPSTTGPTGRTVTHARRVPPRPRRPGLDHPRHPGHRPELHLHPAPGDPDVRPLHLLRVPLPPDRRTRRADRPPPRSVARARHTGMPGDGPGHLHLVGPHPRRRVGAVHPLVPLRQPGAVRRHPDAPEGPVHLRRRQRVAWPSCGPAATRT